MLPRWARDRRRLLILGGIVLIPVTTYMGLNSFNLAVTMAEWPVLAAMAVTLTAVWPDRILPAAPGPWLWSAAMAVLMVTTGVLHGSVDIVELVWMAIINVLAAHVLVMVMAAGFRQHRWVAVQPTEPTWYYLAALAASVVAALLWGFPGQWFGTAPNHLTVWWVVRSLSYAATGTLTVLTLVYWDRPTSLRITHRWQIPLLLALTPLIQILVFRYTTLPLSWMYLIPALWAGLVLTPRLAALYALAAAMIAVRPTGTFDYTGDFLLPPALVIDQLVLMSAYLTMLIALYRHQAARRLATIAEQRAAAEDQAGLMQAVFDSMSDGLVIVDDEGQPWFQNRGVARLLGDAIPAEVLSGQHIASHFRLRSADGERTLTDAEFVRLAQPGDDNPPVEFRLEDDGGRGRVLTMTVRAVDGTSERRVLLLFHDSTAEYERFTQLSRFAGTVAHDLKNPLTSVIGWVDETGEALADDDLETARFSNDHAERSARRMRQIIDDWLAYVIAKEGVLRLGTFPLDPLVEEVIDLQVGPDRADATISTSVEHSVRADRSLVRQLLANIIGNSIKYARPGEPAHIEIATSQTGDEVTVTVADRGVGIQPGDEARIFGAFARSDKDAEAYQGTGLGLALCRSIVERHGGTIRAARNDHGGATITFTLPAA